MIQEFIPQDARREDGRGRPWSERRRVFNGILWILRTGALWQDLPERYGAYQTVHRGAFSTGASKESSRRCCKAWPEICTNEEDSISPSASWMAAFQRPGQGALKLAKPSGARAAKSWQLETLNRLPIAIHTEAAAPAEVKLVEATLSKLLVPEKPLRIIADKACDSDPLRAPLLEDEILLAPHRRGRTKPSFNDGRWLRRYRKRWKSERLFAWLHNFRRLVVRWEYHAENYLAFLQLGCAIILLRYL